MSAERVLPQKQKPKQYLDYINETIAGRTDEAMRASIAEALVRLEPGMTSERAMALLNAVTEGRVSKGGPRERKVSEFYAIVEVAIRLRQAPGATQWPSLVELADAIKMYPVDLGGLLRSKPFPQELREIIIYADPKYRKKSKKVEVK